MVSPKHLWSGDWEAESDASRGDAPTLPAAAPIPEPAPPRPRTPKTAPKTARPPRRRRGRMSREEMRRWAIVGALALLAGFVVTSVVHLATRDDSSKSAAASQSRGFGGAAPVTSATSAAWMGVRTQTWPGGGAIIDGVAPSGPAATAGLAPGDVIIGIDNAPVNSAADVTAALAGRSPGQIVAVEAQRGSAGFTAQVTLASHPSGQSGP